MRLKLPDVRRVAADIARQEDPALQVFAATNGEGADYTEVVLRLHKPSTHPTHIVIGLRRDADESQVRRLLRDRLRDQLRNLSINDPASLFPIRTEDVT
jgi:hypothetical protein